MKRTMIYWSITLACFIGGITPGECTQTEFWTLSTAQEFQRGETEQAAIISTGELTLPFKSEAVLTLKDQDEHVWAMAEDTSGNVYAGTGEQGKIYKITPAGESSVFFDSPEVSILSLAFDAQGNLYAGSAPDGLIYKIAPDGSSQTFYMTGEAYVWSFVFGADGTLYAGTGSAGKIFKILPDGTGSVLYDSPQTHVMALLFSPQGELHAATEGRGMVYKLDADGHAFGLFHAKEEEIHAMAFDADGAIYLAALSSVMMPKAPAENTQEARPALQPKAPKRSVVYRLAPTGVLKKMAEFDDLLIYTMFVDEQQRLLVGTDQKGAMYRILPDSAVQQIIKVKAQQIMSVHRSSSGATYLGTGDPGGVYRLAPDLEERAEYLSPVHDAGTTATWGKIFWRGAAGSVAIATRTGNTALPDDTWSPWSPELTNQAGETISNPPARFIQWKAVLMPQAESVPMLEEVSVAYLPLNLPPEFKTVLTFSATPPASEGAAGRASKSKITPARSLKSEGETTTDSNLAAPESVPAGRIAVLWAVSDPNNDALTYAVSIRAVGESAWKELETDLTEAKYSLDITTLPDGEYEVKITASDEADNPPSHALQTEKISARFPVDNTAPRIALSVEKAPEGGEIVVKAVAQDDASRLKDAEYALDAGEWLPVFPGDMVSDSPDETYQIVLPELADGTHVLTIKVTDRMQNVGVGKIQFTIPLP